MFTDSHCHLTFPEFAGQMPEIRAAMAAAQVDRALCICTKLEEFDEVQALAAAYVTFLDGLLLWSLEQGDAYRRDEAERRALALLRPILAATAQPVAPEIPSVAPQAWSVTEKVPKPRLS